MQYDSDYEVRLAILDRLGGDVTKNYDSVYEIDLAILELTEGGGGGGGGAEINDDIISAGYAWSSRKIDSEMTSRLSTALADVVTDSELQTILASYATSSEMNTALAGKQNTLTAGSRIQIANDVISAISEINDLAASTATTYSSSKITELIAGLGFSVVVVQTLPATGDSQTIYLVPKSSAGTNDAYNEYLYTNSAWEFIGNTQTDLSQYYTKTETNTLLNGKQNTLTAGTNVSIQNGVISATDTTYSAGRNITISANKTISAAGNVASTSVLTIWSGTQAQYDAIATKDANTLYVIKD